MATDQFSLFPRGSDERDAQVASIKASRGDLLNPSRMSTRTRVAIAPIIERSLGPALAQAVARQLGRPGATAEGVLQGLSITGGMEVGRELTDIQQQIEGARQNIGNAPGVGRTALEGGVQGAVAGGMSGGGFAGAAIGGLAGLAGGALAGRSARDAESGARRHIENTKGLATPEEFAKQAEANAPAAREAALAGGAGARRAQALEEAITASGLRDTGIGTLASIAAGVQVPLEGLAATFSNTMNDISTKVESSLAAPIRRPARDPVATALEGLASIFLTRGQPGSASNPIPAQRIPEGEGFGPPLIPHASQTEILSRPGVNF
jgi:hypothetical protein